MDSTDFWLEDLIVSPDAQEDPPVPREGLDFELLSASHGARFRSRTTVTSRISVQSFCATVARFDSFKTRLAMETGLGSMLQLKLLPRLNLKFSTFLMERVDVNERSIRIDDGTSIKFFPEDVRNVFGLPCGARTISSMPVALSEACKRFKHAAAEIGGKGTHSLKVVETILLKELNEASSTQVDIDCFKIAYVVFAVGHVLCPSTKHHYTTVDYWQALCNISKIAEFNWCEYVLRHLMSAVDKLKGDIQAQHSTIQLLGCHLFLQVFVLDNINLGPITLRQNAYPRISLFDCHTLRKMINLLTKSVAGEKSFFIVHVLRSDDVGYTVSNTERIARTRTHNTQYPVISSDQEQIPKQHPNTASPLIDSGTAKSGPVEFAEFEEHIRSRYPKMDAEPVRILLEYNARMCAIMDEMEQKCQEEMVDFADKLMRLVSNS